MFSSWKKRTYPYNWVIYLIFLCNIISQAFCSDNKWRQLRWYTELVCGGYRGEKRGQDKEIKEDRTRQKNKRGQDKTKKDEKEDLTGKHQQESRKEDKNEFLKKD